MPWMRLKQTALITVLMLPTTLQNPMFVGLILFCLRYVVSFIHKKWSLSRTTLIVAIKKLIQFSDPHSKTFYLSNVFEITQNLHSYLHLSQRHASPFRVTSFMDDFIAASCLYPWGLCFFGEILFSF